MISNEEIKLVRSLREKKFREEHGLFVVEGEKLVSEALASDFEVVRIYREDEIGSDKMARMSLLSSPSPVLAVVRQKKTAPASEPEAGLCLALDSVRDPGNFGTIIRLADWFGVSCIYASEDSVELYNPKVIQSTMGAIFRKKIIYCDLVETCRAFLKAGRKVYGTFLNGENIYGMGLESDALVIMGNEANGITPEVENCVSGKITIPCFAPEDRRPESLNVATATAVIMAEFRRRS